MEYCQYGDLQKFQNKKPFSHKHIQNYMLQLRDALQYLRTRNIVHRDLKPQNILLTSPIHIKITDFGLARYINIETELHTPSEHEDLFSTFCGSPIYMSPELLNRQQYNSKSDLWSLGVILYELITGVPPFIAKNIKQLANRVNTEKINLDKIDRTLISDDCFDLLCNLLNHDRTSRVDWNDFFSHKWFSNKIILEEENRLIENPLCYDLINCNNTIHTIPITQTTTTQTTTAETEIIKLTSSSSSGLKFSDHLNINTNSPKPERRHTSIDKSFTFSLKSSRISEELKLKNQQPEHANKINLSDLIQDDLVQDNTTQNDIAQDDIVTGSSSNPLNTATVSKPINIIGRNRYLRTPSSSESGSSTSIQSHMNSAGNSAPTRGVPKTDNNNTSPRGIMNALRFIKETYDYLSSDNKSL
jgi:serine/threonine protein kinase